MHRIGKCAQFVNKLKTKINNTFEDAYPPYKTGHSRFGFKSKNLQDILSFHFTHLDFNSKKNKFANDEEK